MSESRNILDYLPEDTPPYMASAWLSVIRWGLSNRQIINEYMMETGDHFPTVRRTPLDTMIDEATGRDYKFLTDFVQWFNATHWGPMNEED